MVVTRPAPAQSASAGRPVLAARRALLSRLLTLSSAMPFVPTSYAMSASAGTLQDGLIRRGNERARSLICWVVDDGEFDVA